jgi:hypothetical protein
MTYQRRKERISQNRATADQTLVEAMQDLLSAWDEQMSLYEEFDVAKRARAALAKAETNARP